ncbi:HET-domain-containing protein [Periconia macrospinosa]|uniref:HET-domain-containing protein n=1 Tax=Periconia macrospinosa TaxID=97972 RepID=A0A2V1DBU7_9PLEO|nr:HET-domain-containing protein [Periconia macrospinosa]
MIGTGIHIATNGLSETSLHLAQTWLHECARGLGKHAKCAPFEKSKLPTRVIDVQKMRLYQAASGEEGRYVALSHCWGGTTPIRTTKENLKLYLENLPTPLPQTFADAVSVTQALQIPYLWIDSLCIVQDSKEDWDSESAHMANVYENAFVTISADAAKNSFEGFLSYPSRHVWEPAKLQFTNTGQSGAETVQDVYVRQRGKLALMLPYHDWVQAGDRSGSAQQSMDRWDSDSDGGWSPDDEIPYSHLSTRGWVFQERCLSPRTIHFARSETAWECRSICDCECSTTSYRSVRTTSLLKYWLGDFQPDEHHTYWRAEIVREYSRLDLTHATDRLIALAGLAEALGRKRKDDTYLAGLWLNTVKLDIMWCAVKGKPSEKIMASAPAPSWSWAAITGAVEYPTKQPVKQLLQSRFIDERTHISVERTEMGKEKGYGDPRCGVCLHIKGLAAAVELKPPTITHQPNQVKIHFASKRSRIPDNSILEFVGILDFPGAADTSSFTSSLFRGGRAQFLFLAMTWSSTGLHGLLLKTAGGSVHRRSSTRGTAAAYQRVGYVRPAERKPRRLVRRGSYIFDDDVLEYDNSKSGSLTTEDDKEVNDGGAIPEYFEEVDLDLY